jgi:proteasome activator subunit 4
MTDFFMGLLRSNGPLQRILANQYYLVTFLPLSHPQYYLPMMFRLWEAVNSYAFDERMLGFMAKLSEMHIDPLFSDPKRIDDIPEDWGDSPRVRWPRHELSEDWRGLYKDVGIFTQNEWNFIMCKCLASMGRFY